MASPSMGERGRASWVVIAAVAVFFACFALISPQAHAQGESPAAPVQANNDPFEVDGVHVDVTAESAAAARQQALGEGERQAFAMLVERLTLPDSRPTMDRFAPDEISKVVRAFWVSTEKTSSVRYIATLNYSFIRDRVARLLSAKGVRYVTSMSPPALVVPVLVSGGHAVLFDGENPWLKAWSKASFNGMVRWQLPHGDASDLAIISNVDQLAPDDDRLQRLADLYDLDTIALATATLGTANGSGNGSGNGGAGSPSAGPSPSPSPSPAASQAAGVEVSVTLVRMTSDGRSDPVTATYRAQPGETEEALLVRAADGTLGQLDAAWKTRAPVQRAASSISQIMVPVSGLSGWLSIRKRLLAVPSIKAATIAVFGRDRVWVDLIYDGSSDQLPDVLAPAGFTLNRLDDAWVLTDAPPAPKAPDATTDGTSPQPVPLSSASTTPKTVSPPTTPAPQAPSAPPVPPSAPR